MSNKDDKTIEKEGKRRLPDGSAGAHPSPPPGLIGNIRELNEKKTFNKGDGGLLPGAFSVGDTAPSRGEKMRVDENKQNKQADRSVAATKSSDVAHEDGRSEELAGTNLVEAEIAKDVDVEALLKERIQKIPVGIATTIEVQQDDEEREEMNNSNEKAKYIGTVAGLLIVVGGVVSGIALLRSPTDLIYSPTPKPTLPITTTESSSMPMQTPAPTPTETLSLSLSTSQTPTPIPTPIPQPTPAPTSARRATVGAILAELDLVPWNQRAITWLTEVDTWEPEVGDPNRDYLWLERYVMADLYYITNGQSWLESDGWLSSDPVCNWYFKPPAQNECPGPIKDLQLWSNQLVGSFPYSIGSLTQLGWLNLGRNQLNGSIPSSFGSFTQLTSLHLGSNHMTGSIPSSIENLTKLSLLELSENKLTGSIPSSIGSLSQLKYLGLSDNRLTGSIPSSIGSLTQITNLYLNINNLSGTIPVLPSSVSICWLRNNCFQDTSNGRAAGCSVTNNCS